jgi:hypothetical protein
MNYDAIVVGLLAPLFAIIGVIIGSYLSHKSAQQLFLSQKRYEMKVRGYSDVISLRLPLGQTMQTILEAKILSEFYDFRFQQFSHNQFDLNLAQEENKRMLALIPEFTRLRRELFKALAEISFTYPRTQELKDALSELYHIQTLDVTPPQPNAVNSPQLLDEWKSKAVSEIQPLLKQTLNDKVERLVSILDKQLDSE